MTMNKLGKLGLIIYLPLIISCSNGQTKSETENGNTIETIKNINANLSGQQQGYFEGIIEYSIEYDLNNLSLSENKLKKYYGSKVIKKFKEGNFRDEYYNNEGILLRTSVLNLDTKQYYFEIYGIDTMYYSEIDITDYETTIEQLNDTIVLNNNCWVIRSISINKNDNIKTDTVITKFYESKDLKINPDWLHHYIDGGYDRISKIAPGITIKSEYYNSNFTVIKSLTSKKFEKIDPSEFIVETNKFIKKMN